MKQGIPDNQTQLVSKDRIVYDSRDPFNRILAVSLLLHVVIGILLTVMPLAETKMTRLADVMRYGVTHVQFKIPEAGDRLKTPEEDRVQSEVKVVPDKTPQVMDSRPGKKPGDEKGSIKKAGILHIFSDSQQEGKVKSGSIPRPREISFPSRRGTREGQYSTSRSELDVGEDSMADSEFGEKEINDSVIDDVLGGLGTPGGSSDGTLDGGMVEGSGPQATIVSSQGITASGDCRSFKSIEEIIRKRRRGIKVCYDRALRVNPRLEGNVLVRFTITNQGRVARCEIVRNETTVTSNTLLECIVRGIRIWMFDEAPECGDVIVEYGFRLSAPTK